MAYGRSEIPIPILRRFELRTDVASLGELDGPFLTHVALSRKFIIVFRSGKL